MVAESLRDVDEDDSDIDENDPDLLSELSEIVPSNEMGQTPNAQTPEEKSTESEVFIPTTSGGVTDLLQSRIAMYRLAESNAKASGDVSKARRFGRGLKTLEGLLKQAKSGNAVNVDDIPPEVVTKAVEPKVPEPEADVVTQPSRPAPPPPAAITPPSPVSPQSPAKETVSAPKVDEEKLALLLARQKEYKVAALLAKKSGDTEKALGYVKIAKMFDTVIGAAQAGQPVDLSDMPPSPNSLTTAATPMEAQPKEDAERQSNAEQLPEEVVPSEPEQLITASTILEALTQRLEKYKSVEQAAKDESNSSKARRFGRIIKQYEDAIKRYKAGKAVDYSELPCPPGFGPIPGVEPPPADPAPAAPTARAVPPPVLPKPRADVIPSTPTTRPSTEKSDASRASGNHSSTTLMNKNISLVMERQKEFRTAAIEAKKNGDIEQAKEYLKIFKGLENLLNVAKGGLPIDLSTVSSQYIVLLIFNAYLLQQRHNLI